MVAISDIETFHGVKHPGDLGVVRLGNDLPQAMAHAIVSSNVDVGTFTGDACDQRIDLGVMAIG